MIDLYCERLGPGLLAEPLNASTNIAFLLAAWAGWRVARATSRTGADAVTLVALLAAIGVGSGLFHTFATDWAELLDVVPIVAFQLAFLWCYLRQVALQSSVQSGLIVGAFVLAVVVGVQLPQLMNGSIGYAPALAALLALAFYHYHVHAPGHAALAAAAALFMVSLLLRTIDNAVCPALPIGTHFLWHLLNGMVLYIVTSTYLLAAAAVEIRK